MKWEFEIQMGMKAQKQAVAQIVAYSVGAKVNNRCCSKANVKLSGRVGSGTKLLHWIQKTHVPLTSDPRHPCP